MTSIGVPKSVKSFVWRWVTHGLGAVGSAMAVGRIPIEITMHALHLEPEGITAAQAAQHGAGQD
jgi:hypothetical protein